MVDRNHLQHAGNHAFVVLALWSMIQSASYLDELGFLFGCGHCGHGEVVLMGVRMLVVVGLVG